MRRFEILRDGVKVGEGVVWERPKQADGFRVDVQVQDRDGATFEETYQAPGDCEAAYRNSGETVRYLDPPEGEEPKSEPAGKMPSEEIEVLQERQVAMAAEVLDEQQFEANRAVISATAYSAAIMLYLDERLGRAPGKAER